MLLSLTYTGNNAGDFGYLLHKNPARAQVFPLTTGRAYIFIQRSDIRVARSVSFWILTRSSWPREKLAAKAGCSITFATGHMHAVKCRGREYLHIVYGPKYTQSAHLTRLKNRSLTRKRILALQEFPFGLEALERFVQRE